MKNPVAQDSLPVNLSNDLTEESIKLIKKIYDDQKVNDNLLVITGKAFADKIKNIYQKSNAPFDVPDVAMLTRLTSDVWHFSAAKNWHELHDLTQALVDDKGYIRTFSQFKEEASKITQKYNETWLKAEYNLAIASSQNAARWAEFIKDDIKYLRYETVGDSSVRAEHVLLDGVVKNIKSTWWDIHYPPNGWGCRCEAVQAPEATESTKNVASISIPGMFQTNLAKTGLIFPKNHVYYDGVPRNVIKKSILYLPQKNTYMDVMLGDYPIQVHPMHNLLEIENNLRALKSFLDITNLDVVDVKMLPDIHKKDILTKKKYYPDKFDFKNETKNADSIIKLKNGKEIVTDFKYLNGNGGRISKRIDEASEQADYIVIKLTQKCKHNNDKLISIAKSSTKKYNLKGICIIDNKDKLIIDTYKKTRSD